LGEHGNLSDVQARLGLKATAVARLWAAQFKPELFARLQAGSGLAQAWATAHGLKLENTYKQSVEESFNSAVTGHGPFPNTEKSRWSRRFWSTAETVEKIINKSRKNKIKIPEL